MLVEGSSKACSGCKLLRPTTEFHKRNAGDGFQAYCKACRKIVDQEYFQKTREIRYEQVRARKKRYGQWLEQLKASQPCADCRQFFHPAAMAFDHLPGNEKLDNVSDLVRQGRLKLADLEILKCEIVCANCHAIRTYDRRRNGVKEESARYSTRAMLSAFGSLAITPRSRPLEGSIRWIAPSVVSA